MPAWSRFVQGPQRMSRRFAARRIQRRWRKRGVNARQNYSIAKLNRKVKQLTNTLQYKHISRYHNLGSLTTSASNLPQIKFQISGEDGSTAASYAPASLRENMNVSVKSIQVRGQFYNPTSRRDYTQVKIMLIKLSVMPSVGATQPTELDNFINNLTLGFSGFEAVHGYLRSYLNEPISAVQQANKYSVLASRVYTLRSKLADSSNSPAANNTPVQFNLKYTFPKGLIQKYSSDEETSGYANLLFVHFVSSDLAGATSTATADVMSQIRWVES